MIIIIIVKFNILLMKIITMLFLIIWLLILFEMRYHLYILVIKIIRIFDDDQSKSLITQNKKHI